MVNKKLLTLADLYKYYSSKNENVSFSATNDAESIVVQVDGKLNFNKNEETSDYTEGLTPVVLQACHTLCNRNGSMISKENMEKCMPSFKNRPILGYIHEVDGQPEFYGHNMHQNDDGEIIYDEIPIGIIPESCDAKLVYDEEKEHEYVVVNGYLFDDYTKAVEILERENECFVSVELQIRDLSYDAREKALDIKDFFFSGVTILGKSPDGDIVQPGMDGSNIKLADFSIENNSMQFNANKELLDEIKKLNENLSHFNIDKAEFSADKTLEEGGNKTVTKFEELMQKYNKTESDIDFEIEGLSDEELESKFAEEFGEESSEDPASDENGEDSEDDNSEDENKEDTSTQEEMSEDDEEDSEDDSDNSITDTNACGGGSGSKKKKKKKKNELDSSVIKYSVELKGETKIYEVSLDEKIYAIQDLVNAIYSESDNTYYGVKVYDDYVIMVDYWSGRAYKQSYSEEDDSYTLTGDRVEVYSVWVTKEEEEALAEMKSNYAALEQFKVDTENAQLHTQREAILSDKKYYVLTEKDENNEYKNEAYAKLVSEMDNYSLADLEKELKSVFADYITNGGQFAYIGEQESKPTVSKKLFGNSTEKKTSRYGNLFNK